MNLSAELYPIQLNRMKKISTKICEFSLNWIVFYGVSAKFNAVWAKFSVN